ncbi:hypothetical protein JD276_00840 [Leucobacter sp. CSA1]|uniref:AAA+ ATPase domain-containing protein n=1 Tax=Leucobacter chromiisoli TaxID=2796471 RepID=A0A934Q379_9MICO|nr:hypothetical protein [Leucobacter chromiisoli]MBK0417584.1 hypothetical protein [Leucobacter chromiisoli]
MGTQVAEPGRGGIEIEGAYLEGSRGTVFGPITLLSERPVTLVTGARGSGRTSLLLCLAGRMRLGSGRLAVLGETAPAAIRRRVGIAGFAGIDDLEPAVSVGATLRERVAWALPWYRRAPRVTPDLADELLAPAFGGLPRPAPGDLVRELRPSDELLLRIALALVEDPRMLVIDDLDQLSNDEDRAVVAERLQALAEQGIRIAVSTSNPGDAGLFSRGAPEVLALSAPAEAPAAGACRPPAGAGAPIPIA